MNKDEENQVRRLMAEHDLLLSAIAPADYDKIKDQMKQVSESPDTELTVGARGFIGSNWVYLKMKYRQITENK